MRKGAYVGGGVMFWPTKYYDSRSGSDAVATAQWLVEILLSGFGVSRL